IHIRNSIEVFYPCSHVQLIIYHIGQPYPCFEKCGAIKFHFEIHGFPHISAISLTKKSQDIFRILQNHLIFGSYMKRKVCSWTNATSEAQQVYRLLVDEVIFLTKPVAQAVEINYQ